MENVTTVYKMVGVMTDEIAREVLRDMKGKSDIEALSDIIQQTEEIMDEMLEMSKTCISLAEARKEDDDVEVGSKCGRLTRHASMIAADLIFLSACAKAYLKDAGRRAESEK